jgi:hypothetical protein
MMAGADLVLPDRFLDGKPLINLIETINPRPLAPYPRSGTMSQMS